jgi:hypothetical protein
MRRFFQISIGLLSFLLLPERKGLCQERTSVTPEKIINTFIEKIGGQKWLHLESRKEHSYVEYEEDKKSIIGSKSHDRIRIDLTGGKSIEVHQFFGEIRSILVFKPECNWYYSNRSQAIKFFGPEPITFKHTYPRTELMEVLNLEPFRKVYIEDTLYRVDFVDARQLDGTQSLFFGTKSNLLYKRAFTSKNEVDWEFHFSDYQATQRFSEPHRIVLTSNGKPFFSVEVKSLSYNVPVKPEQFTPPISCKNEDYFEHLKFPYRPAID